MSAPANAETPEVRLKRLKLRSIRRGIREMDLLLGAFAADGLDALDPDGLDAYETLLAENDHDILAWITGQTEPPPALASLVSRLAEQARAAANPERFRML
ncbi:FAD assembly factor SdhE [Frigidibacter sp. ROC022]|uniref:FAD assembly factor SdhE n=1 Tax=Frigidibacter sp. ROC022 TaxID=2971796 RepID=UPI00215B0D73|nr:succinate dehydrogenase assembly factor 2 [Frigidibacter sp. ROC022]MCR8723034.1 succinate dehydrogenase assembly factor 2 [Frigidibacter sp. ROC022]